MYSAAPDYEMNRKDYDGEIDPLDELLDAYQTLVKSNMGMLADKVMECVHELQILMLAAPVENGYMIMKNGGGYSNPLACLSQAYLGLVAAAETQPLAAKVLRLMGEVSTAMYSKDDSDMASVQPSAPYGQGEGNASNMEGSYAMPVNSSRVYSVRREVREADNGYGVFSQTGKAFGCYESRSQALERLAELEAFVSKNISTADRQALTLWHNATHLLPVVTKSIKAIHDLIADELEVVHEIAEPYIFNASEQLALLDEGDSMLIAKAAEYRYTLGPAYVPNTEDAHGEFTDEVTLQKAMWDWVKRGDRNIYLQHSDKPAGEMVEMLTWPFPIEADLTVPKQGVTKFVFPADTPFLGVIWEPWAWDMVKAGELRGYSIGGGANRVEADIPSAVAMLTKGESAGHPFRGNQHSGGGGGGGGSGGGPGNAGDPSAPRPKKGESLAGNKNAVGTKVTFKTDDKLNGKTGVVVRQGNKRFMVKVDGDTGTSLSVKGEELIAS